MAIELLHRLRIVRIVVDVGLHSPTSDLSLSLDLWKSSRAVLLDTVNACAISSNYLSQMYHGAEACLGDFDQHLPFIFGSAVGWDITTMTGYVDVPGKEQEAMSNKLVYGNCFPCIRRKTPSL